MRVLRSLALSLLAALLVYWLLTQVRASPAPHAELLTGQHFEVMAHGAGQGHGPKNTLEAALIAVNLGASYIEMDVHRSSDGIFVAIHDDTVDATTDGSGRVDSMTLAQLQGFDAGHGFVGGDAFVNQGVRIPTMAAVFEALPKVKYLLEIKPDDASFAAPFCALLRHYQLQQQVIIASFHQRSLSAFRQQCPEIPTSLAQSEVTRFVLLQKMGLSNLGTLPGTALQVPLQNNGLTIVSRDFIEAAHRRGLEVHVWTVNDLATIEWLRAIGADGVITDFPGRVIR